MNIVLMSAILMSFTMLTGCSDDAQFGGSGQGAERPVEISENQDGSNSDDAFSSSGNKPFALELSCKEEQLDLVSKSVKMQNGVIFSPNTSCSNQFEKIDEKQNNQIDLVIVLDITGSMASEMATVKKNVVEFSERLAENGWDAKFSLVAFRDEIVIQSNFFKPAAEIADDINLLRASGGKDYQEAGQLAISAAMDLMASKRPTSVAAVLYVTDAPAWGANKDDLTIEVMKKAIQSRIAKDKLDTLHFFSSVAGPKVLEDLFDGLDEVEASDAEGEIFKGFLEGFLETSDLDIGKVGAALPDALSQVKKLRDSLKLPGIDVGFPLQAKALLEDIVVSIEQIKSNVDVSCKIEKIKLNGVLIPKEPDADQWLLSKEQFSEGENKVLVERRCDGFGYKISQIVLTSDESSTPSLEVLQ